MGPIILFAVLLHAFSSYWQLRKQPKGRVSRGRVDATVLVRVVIIIKELIILPAIVLMLLLYSLDSSAAVWVTVEQLGATWIEIVGLALVVSSILLKVRAYKALGRNWSAKPTIYEDHALITKGPYRWIRHPVYTSNIIMLLGVFLATSSISLLIMGIFYFVTDIIRGNEEEKKLTTKFGNSYTQYVSTVGKYVPITMTLSFAGIVVLFNIIGIVDELLFNLAGYSFTATWIAQVLSSIM